MRTLVSLLILLLIAPAGGAQVDEPRTLRAWFERELDTIETWAEDDGDLTEAAESARSALLTYVHHARDPDDSLVRRGALMARHYSYLGALGDDRHALQAFLAEHAPLRDPVAALIHQTDDPQRAYTLLDELREARGKKLSKYPELVAALCVVFDRPRIAPLIEQRVEHPATPLQIFDHLVNAGGYLRHDPRSLPGEMLVHVVNINVSANDLAWACRRYKRHQTVGKTYHEVPYDTRSIKQTDVGLKLDTALEREEMSLELVRRVGGVCRQQGYFAANVGKALGVPTAYARADGPDLGHAWVGYYRGGSLGWDFDEGRYDDYEKIRAEITDPQTGRVVGDEQVAFLADLMHCDAEQRRVAVAYLDAARSLQPDSVPDNPIPGAPDALKEPRPADNGTRLWLLEQGLRACPATQRGWEQLGQWAGDLDAAQRAEWFEVIDRLVGKRYPDVMLGVLRPMIRAIENPKQRDRAWAWAMDRVSRRPQLVVELAVERGKSRIEAGDPEGAWQMFTTAATGLPNEGPFVVDALREAEGMLKPHQMSYVLDAYKDVFRRIARPGGRLADSYRPYSTYYKVGSRYADLLSRHGDKREADRIRREIER